MNTINRCVACGAYTMKSICACGKEAVTPKPAKFSPEDKYGSYRRKAKQLQEKTGEHGNVEN